MGMPGMGGSKCLSAIMELDPKTKVIIASGYAGDDQVRNSLDAGAMDFVAKPYHMKDLLNTIRKGSGRRSPGRIKILQWLHLTVNYFYNSPCSQPRPFSGVPYNLPITWAYFAAS